MIHAIDRPLADAIASFVAYLHIERGLAENTVLAYGFDLQRFGAWATAAGMADFLKPTLAEAHDYLAHLCAAGLSAPSRSRHLAAVKQFYRFLIHDERTTAAGPILTLEAPKTPQRLPRPLSPARVEGLLAGVDDGQGRPNRRNHPWPLRNRALIEVLFATGCRVSEVCRLQLLDVNLTERVCRVHGKGAKERIVLFGRPAAAALDAYLHEERPLLVARDPGCPWVFVSREKCRPVSRLLVYAVLKDAARAAGLPASVVSPHALRHGMATALVAGGADLRVVQTLLGHESIVTTEKYVAVDGERLRKVHREYHPRGK